jgi:acetyl-CoA carboxylase carboxyltransferase component
MIKVKELEFHNNCKGSRILEAVKCTENPIYSMIMTKGVFGFSKDAMAIKRYKQAIANAVNNKVLVSK